MIMLIFSKTNPWPAAIIVYFVIFITATAGMIVFSLSHKDELVTSDYYEQEIQFQRQIDRLERTRAIQAGLAVAYDPAAKQIRIELPTEHARQYTEGQVQFHRPSAASLDRRINLEVDPATGRQTVDARPFEPGLWKVRVSWTFAGRQFFFDRNVIISKSS